MKEAIVMQFSSLGPYTSLIAQHAPHNQATAKQYLENPPSQDGKYLALDRFFGAKYLLNYGGERGVQNFKSELAKVGGGEVECVVPYVPSEEDYKKIFRNYKNYDLSNPEEAAHWKEQRKKEIVPVLTFLHLLRRVKASLITACQSLQEAQAKHDEAGIARAKRDISRLCQPVIFQDNAHFGFVSPDRTQVTLNDLAPLFHRALNQLPDDWGLFYFEAWAKEPPAIEESSDDMVRVGRSLLCSAFVVNFTLLDELESQLAASEKERCGPLDNIIGCMARKHKFYAVKRSIVFRKELDSPEPKQAQPVFSPIDIQREAANVRKTWLKVEVGKGPAWEWQKLFGTMMLAPSADVLRQAIEGMQKNWEEAQIEYRRAQDALQSGKSSDETAYKKAEERRKIYSSVFIDLGGAVFNVENTNQRLSDRSTAVLACSEALSKLPKDWQIIYFDRKTEIPQMAFSFHAADLSNMRAMAVNYVAYKKMITVLTQKTG